MDSRFSFKDFTSSIIETAKSIDCIDNLSSFIINLFKWSNHFVIMKQLLRNNEALTTFVWSEARKLISEATSLGEAIFISEAT